MLLRRPSMRRTEEYGRKPSLCSRWTHAPALRSLPVRLQIRRRRPLQSSFSHCLAWPLPHWTVRDPLQPSRHGVVETKRDIGPRCDARNQWRHSGKSWHSWHSGDFSRLIWCKYLPKQPCPVSTCTSLNVKITSTVARPTASDPRLPFHRRIRASFALLLIRMISSYDNCTPRDRLLTRNEWTLASTSACSSQGVSLAKRVAAVHALYPT